MKKMQNVQELNEIFKFEKLEDREMFYLRGGDGPLGQQDDGDDDPPILP